MIKKFVKILTFFLAVLGAIFVALATLVFLEEA